MSDMTQVPEDLIEDIHYHLNCFDTSRSRANAGHHLIELFNAVGNLVTWHGGFDINTGTLPWQREDDIF